MGRRVASVRLSQSNRKRSPSAHLIHCSHLTKVRAGLQFCESREEFKHVLAHVSKEHTMASPRRNSRKRPSRNVATEPDGRNRPETRNTTEPVSRTAAEVDPFGCVTTLNLDRDGNLFADEETLPSGRRRGRRYASAPPQQQQGPTVAQPRNPRPANKCDSRPGGSGLRPRLATFVPSGRTH